MKKIFFSLLLSAFALQPLALNADVASSSTPTTNAVQPTLPDLMVTGLSIQNKKGANEGWYLYVTAENDGGSITSASFLSIALTGLEPIGLPKGYVMYLTHDKNADGTYSYPSGYKKDLIGPKVIPSALKELTVTATIDPGSYFTESDRSNNALTKTLTLPTVEQKPTEAQHVVAVEEDENEAGLIVQSGTDLQKLLDHGAFEKDVDLQKKMMKKYTEALVKKMKLSENQQYSINNFIVYGTASTAKMTPAKRANLLKTFKKKTKRLPKKEVDWQKILDAAVKK